MRSSRLLVNAVRAAGVAAACVACVAEFPAYGGADDDALEQSDALASPGASGRPPGKPPRDAGPDPGPAPATQPELPPPPTAPPTAPGQPCVDSLCVECDEQGVGRGPLSDPDCPQTDCSAFFTALETERGGWTRCTVQRTAARVQNACESAGRCRGSAGNPVVCEPVLPPETAEFNGACSRFQDCEAGDLRVVPVERGTPCDDAESMCDGAGNCMPKPPPPPPTEPSEPPDEPDPPDPPEPEPLYCGIMGVPFDFWAADTTAGSCGTVNLAPDGVGAMYGCRFFVDFHGDPRATPNCALACQTAGFLLGIRLQCHAQWDEEHGRACGGREECRCNPDFDGMARTCFDGDDNDFICDCVPVE